jgi:probable HAF family extracellular repeat protein
MQPLRKILLVVLTLAPAGAVTHDFVTFAGPNGANIYPHAINNSGQVVGAFVDSAGASHGFLRSADGTSLTAIDVPGATSTAAVSINNSGWIVGFFVTSGTIISVVPFPGTHGFRLAPDGTLTIIDAPGAEATVVLQINNGGLMVGEYIDDVSDHGFLLAPDGKTFTTFDTGFGDTWPYGLNDNGDVVGRIYVEAGDQRKGWLRSAAGVFTFFREPAGYDTAAMAINNAGQIVGYYTTPPFTPHAFLRSADGSSYTTLETPGTSTSTAVGINSSGEIVGAFGGGYDVRNPDGTFDSVAVPGTSPAVTAINDAGQIVGSFTVRLSDGKSHTYGFIPVPTAPTGGPLITGVIGASAFGAYRVFSFSGGSVTVSVASGSWIEI